MALRPRSSAGSPASPGRWTRWILWFYFPLLLVLSVAAVCLWQSGKWLVRKDAFGKAAWTVVLAGESRDCERTDAAVKLYREGRIDSVIQSATRTFKNRYASEFMVEYMVKQGFPRGKVFEFRQDTYSTLEEARELVKQFHLMELDTVLILTSNYHTGRTSRIFRELAQGRPEILVYPADYGAFDPGAWWASREGRKIWLEEWLRVVYTFFELQWTKPETGKAEFDYLVPDIWTRASGKAAPITDDIVVSTGLDSPAIADTVPKDSAPAVPAPTTALSGDDKKDTVPVPGSIPAASKPELPKPKTVEPAKTVPVQAGNTASVKAKTGKDVKSGTKAKAKSDAKISSKTAAKTSAKATVKTSKVVKEAKPKAKTAVKPKVKAAVKDSTKKTGKKRAI